MIIFRTIVLSISNKLQNTLEGLQKIINYRASLNLGMPKNLKEAFPLTVPIKIQRIERDVDFKILNPEWVSRFSTGESNLFISVQKSKNKSGLSVWLRFSIGQHSKDILLLEGLVIFFGCGYVTKYAKRSICEYIITKIDHIADNIIPFFDKHPIIGSKFNNYIDFKNAFKILKTKEHLNLDGKGLNKLLQLKYSISKSVGNHNNNYSARKKE